MNLYKILVAILITSLLIGVAINLNSIKRVEKIDSDLKEINKDLDNLSSFANDTAKRYSKYEGLYLNASNFVLSYDTVVQSPNEITRFSNNYSVIKLNLSNTQIQIKGKGVIRNASKAVWYRHNNTMIIED